MNMEQVIANTPAKERLITLAEKSTTNDALTVAGRQALPTKDFPTSRQEAWKYTRTGRIANAEWSPVSVKAEVDVTPYCIPGLDAQTVVFVDGIYRDDLSSLKSSELLSVKSALSMRSKREAFDDVFQAMHAALCTSHVQIDVCAGSHVSQTIHFIHIAATDKVLALPSIGINTGKSSQLHVAESFVSLQNVNSFSCRQLSVVVGENATLHYNKIQSERDHNFLLNEENISIEKNGNITFNTLTIDGGWVRNQLNVDMLGVNIEANINGIYMPRGNQFVDNHTRIDHRHPHCNSNELYKGLLNEHSTGVFNGKVYVWPDAQKTNAFQSNANILLSENAQMNTKPELEIYADDVKCSHGSTTGRMDEEALFYLKSRGLGKEGAMKLLSTAFISDVLNKIQNEHVRTFIINELTNRGLLYN